MKTLYKEIKLRVKNLKTEILNFKILVKVMRLTKLALIYNNYK